MSNLNSSETAPREPDLQDIAAKINGYRKSMEAKLSSWRIHPWKEHNRGWEPRLRIYHLDQGAGNYTTPNLDRRDIPQHLWQDLEEGLGEEAPSKPYHRLILLEGMDPRIAEALSIKLNIPSGFWIAHCRAEGKFRPLSPSGVGYTSSIYWKVQVPTKLSIVWNKEISPAMQFDQFLGSCLRAEISLTSANQVMASDSCVSFWAKYTASGWIGLILMDASDGFLLPHGQPTAEIPGPFLLQAIDKDSVPSSTTNSYAIVGSQSPESRMISPYELSLWDMATEAYEKEAMSGIDDPFSATTVIRNFIFLKWEDFMHRTYHIANTIWVSGPYDEQELLGVSSENQNQVLERSKKIAAEYQRLRVLRQFLQQRTFRIRHISRAFQSKDDEYLQVQGSRNWANLLEHIRFIDELMSGNMAMYAQRAAMEEAFASRSQAYDTYRQTEAANEQAAAANRTARSSGQLAKIATVAVPCTVAASVLSMNGDFAAGERLFFVYWCVAVPLTVILLCWVIQKDFTQWRREGGKKEQGTKASEKPVKQSLGYLSKASSSPE